MDFEEMTPAECNALIIGTIPSVISTVAARIFEPNGDLLSQVVQEQVRTAEEELGLSGIEFGLIKLQAAERVCVWLVRVLAHTANSTVEDVLVYMTETASQEGITGMFGTGEGS